VGVTPNSRSNQIFNLSFLTRNSSLVIASGIKFRQDQIGAAIKFLIFNPSFLILSTNSRSDQIASGIKFPNFLC